MNSSFKFEPKAYPELPGIYRMQDDEGKTIYIGKALDLRKRLSQYFQGRHDGRYQLDLLVQYVANIEVITTKDERDALVLENQLIKREKPKYNIRLKDDKTYPYIRLSKDAFPRIEVSREKGEKEYEYFGPYTVVSTASLLVEFIATQYGLRRCPGIPLIMLDRPCLYAQIGQCSAPCIKKIDQEEYMQQVLAAKKLLKGQSSKAIQDAKQKMEHASEEMNYELAAHYRDQWKALQNFERGSILEGGSHQNADIISCIEYHGWFIIVALQVKTGKLWNHETFQIRALAAWEDELSSFLLEFYSYREIPPLIVIDEDSANFDALSAILNDRSSTKTEIRQPKRGELKSWLTMARQNARAELSCRDVTGELDGQEYLARIQHELSLPKIPTKAIAIDAAIFGLEEAVGSVVTFKDGKMDKQNYRKFKMKYSRGGDGDIYYIQEILTRYLNKNQCPNLILIDGGQAQLKAAAETLLNLGLKPDHSLLAISKGDGRRSGRECIHIWNDHKQYYLEDLPISMRFWTEMRDEAHRFANQFNAKRIRNKRLSSPFKKIPGIGPKTEKVLRDYYGSMKEMLKADIESLEHISINKRQKNMLKHWILANRPESD